MIYNSLRFFTIYNLLDNGVSNVLGLQTLRHGTNLYNYCKIQMEGAQPFFGGTGVGSEPNHSTRSSGKFYVWKDRIDEAWVNQGQIWSDGDGKLLNDWTSNRKRYDPEFKPYPLTGRQVLSFQKNQSFQARIYIAQVAHALFSRLAFFRSCLAYDWTSDPKRYNEESKPYPLTARQVLSFQKNQSVLARSFAASATHALFSRLPFFRSCLAYSEGAHMLNQQDVTRIQLIGNTLMFVGIEIIGALTPQIKFHFTDQQIEDNVKTGRFWDDPLLMFSPIETIGCDEGPVFFIAFVTNKVIENSHLGVSGSLRQGLNENLFQNMKNHPYKVLYGSACLTASVLLCRSLYRDVISVAKPSILSKSPLKRVVRLIKGGTIVSGMLLYNAFS